MKLKRIDNSKMKLKRIGNSKIPTPQQMLNMAVNLETKIGLSAKIECNVWAFSSKNCELTYGVYLTSFNGSKEFTSWPDALKFYRKLMSNA